MHGCPHNGYILRPVIAGVTRNTGIEPRAGRWWPIQNELKHRAGMEPRIGNHGRDNLKGIEGERINAPLAAARCKSRFLLPRQRRIFSPLLQRTLDASSTIPAGARFHSSI